MRRRPATTVANSAPASQTTRSTPSRKRRSPNARPCAPTAASSSPATRSRARSGFSARGVVYTGGASLVRKFTPRLDLGAELTGALTRNSDLGKGQLRTQAGGNYALSDNLTLDFGLVAGRSSGSPRLGAQLGISADF